MRTRILVTLASAGSTFIPQLRPINIAFVSALVIKDFHPLWLALLTVGGSTGGTFIQRHLYQSIFAKRVTRKVETISYKNDKLKKIYQKLERADSQRAMFLASCAIFYSPIPDIVIIMLVRHKLSVRLFLLAAIIGKAVVYLPYVFGVEGLQQLWQLFF